MYYRLMEIHPAYDYDFYLKWANNLSLTATVTVLLVLIAFTIFSYLTYKLILKIYGYFK